MNKIYVFGHQKPDTDTVTSSIALSYLKNQLGMNTEPRILGDINKETQFVLDYFKIKKPKYLDSVKLQIKDINYYHNLYINEKESINETYNFLLNHQITAIPVVDDSNQLMGMVRAKDILRKIKNDDNYLDTSYDNLLTVLKAQSINKYKDEIKGKTILKGNYLFVKDNDQLNLVIMQPNSDFNKELFKDVNIIESSLELTEAIKLLPWCNYIASCIIEQDVLSFSDNTYYDDFMKDTAHLHHNHYPIIGKNNICKGLIRLTDIMVKDKKQVILVDHNEPQQSVDGLDEAEVLEIIDHHKIGTLPTNNPISFRNMIVGSTNTIIYQMYQENHIEIPFDIAGLMISGILSDTLGLTSSTTTDLDKKVVNQLEQIISINYKEYYFEMLKKGTSLANQSKEEIIKQDLKYFQVNDLRYAISQVITLDIDNILNEKDDYIKIINDYKKRHDLKLFLLIITDALKQGSYLIYSNESEQMLQEIFKQETISQGIFIDNLTSRKKQVVPYINEYLK